MEIDEIKALLLKDPGNPAAVQYAQSLFDTGLFDSVIRVLLAALSANPSLHKGRLLLARTYYQMGYRPFALRELEELSRSLPENKSISKLLEKFGRSVTASNSLQTQHNLNESNASGNIGASSDKLANVTAQDPEGTVAEIEFDVDDIDLVEDKEG